MQISQDIVFRDVQNFYSEGNELFEEFSLRLNKVFLPYKAYLSSLKTFNLEKNLNTFMNFNNLSNVEVLSEKRNTWKGVPAIICGAGESLSKDLENLKKQDKAVVIAGGTALRILTDENSTYDIAAGIDPMPPQDRLRGLKDPELFCVVTLYNHFHFLKGYRGNCLLAQELENFLEKEVFSRSSMTHLSYDYGYNVGNFMAFIAAYLGFNPIYMTGVDMGFKDREYSRDQSNEQKKHYKVNSSDQTIYTRDDQRLAKVYFEKLCKAFPDTLFYQSESSLDSPKGFRRISLLDFLKPLKSLDKSEIHSEKKSQRKIDLRKISQSFEKEFIEELRSISVSVQKALNKCKDLQDKDVGGKTFRSEWLALEDYEIESSSVYRLVLEPIWIAWEPILYRDNVGEENFLEKAFQRYLFFQRVLNEYEKKLQL